jgi:hypothetical protein
MLTLKLRFKEAPNTRCRPDLPALLRYLLRKEFEKGLKIRVKVIRRRMKRLDPGHLHPKLDVPGLTCPSRGSNPGLQKIAIRTACS